ncbi:hypothetical protein GCM10009771_04200 [Nesterenkonia flava]
MPGPAVGVWTEAQYTRGHRRQSRVREVPQQDINAPLRHHHIRINEKYVGGAHPGQSGVARCRRASVDVAGDDLRSEIPGERDDVLALLAGSVIDDDDGRVG